MGKVRTKSGWLGDEVGTWVSYDDYKQLEAQLDAVRKVQRYEVEPDMMEGNPPVCGTPDVEGEWVLYRDIAALNGEGK